MSQRFAVVTSGFRDRDPCTGAFNPSRAPHEVAVTDHRPPLTDEEIGPERPGRLPKVTQLAVAKQQRPHVSAAGHPAVLPGAALPTRGISWKRGRWYAEEQAARDVPKCQP